MENLSFIEKFKAEFTFLHLKEDIPASLAVFLVAVPLCLGIAHASGTPLISGLITGAIGGLVVGFLSKSPLSVSGPAAGLTAIVAAAASDLGNFGALLVAVFLAGLIQVVLGVVRAGALGSYIPSAVIKGMLSAIGIILILKQLPHLMGYDAEDEGIESFIIHGNEIATKASDSGGHAGIGNTFSLLWDAVQNIQTHIFLIGLASIVLIVVWEKTLGKKIKVIPGSLLAVVAGTGMAVGYRYFATDLSLTATHLVQIPSINSFQSFMAQSTFPAWSYLSEPKVYTVALTIALVASIETLLSIEAIDKLDTYKRKTPTNRELIAQGIGNSTSGLIGGIPLTSVIVRSSVNQVSGGRTKMSAIFHGLWIVLAVALAAPVMNLIPLSALAAVLITVGFKLAHPKQFKALFQGGMDQFVPYVVTIVAIVLTDLLIGVLIGMAVSAVFILYNHYKSDVVYLEKKEGMHILTFAENVTFLNKARVQSILESLPNESQVVLDTVQCKYIDHDVVEIIKDFRINAKERGIVVTTESRLDGKYEPAMLTHTQRLKHMEALDEVVPR